MLTPEQLTGCEDTHLTDLGEVRVTDGTAKAYLLMQKAAERDGVTMAIASGFRSFEAQASIFNRKARGELALRDSSHNIIATPIAEPRALLKTILIWSALPGASRHHWGTDIDLFDPCHIEHGQLELVQSEFDAGGPCHELACWLEKNARDFGFYRPYRSPTNGVQPEPWHYSYKRESDQCLANFEIKHLRDAITKANVELSATIESELDKIFEHYVLNVDKTW
ncbi:peptidase M15 [Paraferrimonas sedimenticola]|uniref:Peptidase M15 n=1 Tax=Paraferrimonas sedimenticola TaxID=375674 RepID=A0AA37RU11_9GAMM|nr:peptidase M15 [Paraferrimonas sedimenticola]